MEDLGKLAADFAACITNPLDNRIYAVSPRPIERDAGRDGSGLPNGADQAGDAWRA